MVRVIGGVAAAIAAIAAIAAVGCAPSQPAGVSRQVGAAATAASALAAGPHTMTTANGERTYTVRRPALPGPLPMLVVLHGAGSSGTDVERDSGFTQALGDRALIVYPDGVYGTWNAGGCCLRSQAEGVDDLGFLSSLLRAAIDEGAADPARLFVAGFSNGGMMAYDLLCNGPVRIAGAQIVAGALVSPCGTKPVGARVVVMHDRGDVMVKPAGYDGVLKTGQYLHYPSLAETIATLRRDLGCATAATVVKPRVAAYHWASCAGGGDLTVDLVTGVGHTWPGNRALPERAGDPVDATNAGILLLNI